MSRINRPVAVSTVVTHEGAPARRIPPLAELRRTVSSCLLWESEFYEDGVEIAKRIAQLVAQCDPNAVAALAIYAREDLKLRHVPLLLVRELARRSPTRPDRLVAVTIARVIQRADELAEFLSIYWKDGKTPISKQVKRGLAWALRKFDEYELAKYNRDSAVKLRDVMFLVRPKPKDEAQAALWKKLAEDKLTAPDTWEVALSAGADKRATFTRLIETGKLGYLALLRNLRNMEAAGVDRSLIELTIAERKGAGRVLPFRFIAAARAMPTFEPVLDGAMIASLAELPKLPGMTIVLVDVSGSMQQQLSGKSDLMRADAAAGMAIVARGLCTQARVFAFSMEVKELPARSGMALRDALDQSMPHGGTDLGGAVKFCNALPHDRLIVVSDEQTATPVPNPVKTGYMINVASAQNGVGYGPWVHIDGFSEGVVRFIFEHERLATND